MQADAIAGDRDLVFFRNAGRSTAKCRVTGNRQVGIHRVCRREGTTHANLFLHRPDNMNFAVVMYEVLDGSNDGPAANTIVEALRDY